MNIAPVKQGAPLKDLYENSRQQVGELHSQQLNNVNTYRFGTTIQRGTRGKLVKKVRITDIYKGPFAAGYFFDVNTKTCEIFFNTDGYMMLGSSVIPYNDANSQKSFFTHDIYEKTPVYIACYAYMWDITNNTYFEGLYPVAGQNIAIYWSYRPVWNRTPVMSRNIWSRIVGVIYVEGGLTTGFEQWWKGGDIYIDGRIG